MLDLGSSKLFPKIYTGRMVKIGFNKNLATNFELKPYKFDQKITSLVKLNETEKY